MRFINLCTVQALIIPVILVLAGLLVLTPSDGSHKTPAADRTFNDTRQNMLMIHAVSLIPFYTGIFSPEPCRLPEIPVYDCLVHPINNHIIISHDSLIFIPAAFDLFGLMPSVNDLSGINGIIKDLHYKTSGEIIQFLLLYLLFRISVLIQIITDSVCSKPLMSKLCEDDLYDLRLFRIDDQRAVLGIQRVPEWSLPAVPLALSGFLAASFHRLYQNVFSFYFGNSRQNRNSQLTGILGRINPVFHADQVYTEILYILKGIKNIRRISSESRKLEYKDEIHSVTILSHIIQHLGKLWSSSDILTGLSCVAVFPDYLYILKIRELRQPLPLSFKAVALHLY